MVRKRRSKTGRRPGTTAAGQSRKCALTCDTNCKAKNDCLKYCLRQAHEGYLLNALPAAFWGSATHILTKSAQPKKRSTTGHNEGPGRHRRQLDDDQDALAPRAQKVWRHGCRTLMNPLGQTAVENPQHLTWQDSLLALGRGPTRARAAGEVMRIGRAEIL